MNKHDDEDTCIINIKEVVESLEMEEDITYVHMCSWYHVGVYVRCTCTMYMYMAVKLYLYHVHVFIGVHGLLYFLA